MWKSMSFCPSEAETDRTCWTIQTHSWDEINWAISRNFHEIDSLSLVRLMKSSTFGLGLRDKKNNNNKAESFFLSWKWAAVKRKRIGTHTTFLPLVTREFLEVSRCCRAKQRQRNVQKSVLQVQNCFLIYNLPTILFFYKNVFDKTIEAEICKI